MPQEESIFTPQRAEASFAQPKESDELNNLSRRLRVLEERYASIERKLQISEQNMLRNAKRADGEIKASNADITEIKQDIADIKDKITGLVRELQSAAKREELDVLKKYLSFWEPVNFVTQQQVERIVKDMIDNQKS